MDHIAERLGISEVIGAYGFFYDTGRWEAFGELFAEDAAYNITPDPKFIPLPLQGRIAIRDEMRARHIKSGNDVFPRHLATNIVFRHVAPKWPEPRRSWSSCSPTSMAASKCAAREPSWTSFATRAGADALPAATFNSTLRRLRPRESEYSWIYPMDIL